MPAIFADAAHGTRRPHEPNRFDPE